MGTTRNAVFTFNNPDIEPDEMWRRMMGKCKYMVMQLEKGENGTPHYQGYVEMNSPQRMWSGFKTLMMTDKIHWEQRRGTADQARDYSMKKETREDGPWEFGVWHAKKAGRRSDLDAIKDAVDAGKSNLEIIEEVGGRAMILQKHINDYRSLKRPVRTEELEVILILGEPGTGKSRWAYETYPDCFANPLGKDLWFNNYKGEQEVLLDDFSGNISLVDFLRITDRYAVQVPIKGGFVWWCPNKIIITSNVHPYYWYDYSKRQSSWEALKRRIHTVYQFDMSEEHKKLKNVREDVLERYDGKKNEQ